MAKKAQKAYSFKPTKFPSRQCPSCSKWYHARAKECPGCGAANPTRGSVVRRIKKVRRVKRRVPGQLGRPAVGTGNALEAAIELVRAAGGIEQARAALATIERIRGL